ncbi:MAG: hypothetical protein IH874_07945 [Candidatus Dadabacteria bacterium]|nr:hypothetical protein [Candidatus Dadabacteria bacterium]
MEVVGKMMILFVLIGGLGLGVSEILTRDIAEVDILGIPFKFSDDDKEAIDQYKEELTTEAKGYMQEVKPISNKPAPETLWKQDAEESVLNNGEVKKSIALNLAEANSSAELRKEMLLWHKKYHRALRSGSDRDVRVALENYQNYKSALDLKQ